MRLENRVAVVTGGSRGIGRAYAERLLREGARVVVADVDDAAGSRCVDELSAIGPIVYRTCDVAVADSASSCAEQAVETFGRIDILVNNAALYGDWDMADQSEAYLHRVFDVNLHGVWLMTRAVAPYMVRSGHGRIINQASSAAYDYAGAKPTGDFVGLNAFNYQQTKWGVVGLTKFSAAQLGRYGITVNCIAPGMVATDATRHVVSESVMEALADQQPVPGVLQPDDLAGAVVYFASDDARFVTGQVLVIDGGKHMPA